MENPKKIVFHLENQNYGTNIRMVHEDSSQLQLGWQNIDKKKYAVAVNRVRSISTVNNNINIKEDKQVKPSPAVNQMSLWKRYCTSSTVHGLRYIADDELNFRER